jgi:prepilin-type N-terminal cleavage/methylation domain-containing protein
MTAPRARRSPHRARGPREGGFTLIEILIALLVFLTGVTGLLALLTTALAMHRDGVTLARVSRDIDGAMAQLRREVAAGQHWDAVHETFVDVPGALLPNGTAWAVHFLPARGEQPLLAELRVAGSVKELPRARPLPVVLTPGPAREDAVQRFRNRGRGQPLDAQPPPDSQAPPSEH